MIKTPPPHIAVNTKSLKSETAGILSRSALLRVLELSLTGLS